jgi:hypothetical protein
VAASRFARGADGIDAQPRRDVSQRRNARTCLYRNQKDLRRG